MLKHCVLVAVLLSALCSGKVLKKSERVREVIKQEARKKVRKNEQSDGTQATLTVNSSVVNSQELEYTINVNGQTFLSSGESVFRSGGSKLSNLMLNQSYVQSGVDSIGSFSAQVYEWVDSTVSHSPSVITKIKSYPSKLNVVVFAQEFPNGLSGTSIKDADKLSSVFPSFVASSSPSNNSSLGWVHFGGFMAAGQDLQHGTLTTNGMSEYAGGMHGSGALCFFKYDFSESVVISPLNRFMAASDSYDQNSNNVQFGVMGNVTDYPVGWDIEFIMVATNGGINQAMYRWGDEMLSAYDKRRDDSWDRDLTLNFLGYSTDRGAFYYYFTEPYKNYEDTMIDVSRYAKYESIPYKYMLLDSWWYYKGEHSGLANWTARPDIFPHGMAYVYEESDLYIQAHSRYFSIDTVYANNNPVSKQSGYTGPTFPFIWADETGIPESADFWDSLFEMNDDWGLIVYEQDWMSKTLDEMAQLKTDVNLGENWLLQMASMAEAHEINIQYCMSYPRQVLTSLLTKSVTQARGSADFEPNKDNPYNWQIGTSGLFLGAIGLGNSKDSFWSSQWYQYNSHYNSHGLSQEYWPRLESVAATMANGPVQVGDQMIYSDQSLIMRSATKDGRLLRSGHNAASLDRYFRACAFKDGSQPFSPVLWTESRIPGYPYPYAYVLAANLTADFYLESSDVDLDGNGVSYLIFEANTTDTFTLLGPGNSGYKCSSSNPWDFEFLTMIPLDESISNEWYLQGEIDKWISVSPFRFTQIDLNSDGILVEFTGANEEVVHIGFVNLLSMQRVVLDCEIGESMVAYAKCFGNECVCAE